MAATGRSDSVELNKCRRALALARIFTSEDCQFCQSVEGRAQPTMGAGRIVMKRTEISALLVARCLAGVRNSCNGENTLSVIASTL